MIIDNRNELDGKVFELDKTYYFDKSGLSIKEAELQALCNDCTPKVEACCRIELPRGFKFSEECPGMCFDLSELSCIKSPIVKNVDLPACDKNHPVQCEVVAGYEIRVIGDVHFSVSTPICPIKGKCFPVHSHVCCEATAPVNHPVAYTCCPKPCYVNTYCVDWTYAFFTIHKVDDCCGPYLKIEMGVVLEYDGIIDSDEE